VHAKFLNLGPEKQERIISGPLKKLARESFDIVSADEIGKAVQSKSRRGCNTASGIFPLLLIKATFLLQRYIRHQA